MICEQALITCSARLAKFLPIKDLLRLTLVSREMKNAVSETVAGASRHLVVRGRGSLSSILMRLISDCNHVGLYSMAISGELSRIEMTRSELRRVVDHAFLHGDYGCCALLTHKVCSVVLSPQERNRFEVSVSTLDTLIQEKNVKKLRLALKCNCLMSTIDADGQTIIDLIVSTRTPNAIACEICDRIRVESQHKSTSSSPQVSVSPLENVPVHAVVKSDQLVRCMMDSKYRSLEFLAKLVPGHAWFQQDYRSLLPSAINSNISRAVKILAQYIPIHDDLYGSSLTLLDLAVLRNKSASIQDTLIGKGAKHSLRYAIRYGNASLVDSLFPDKFHEQGKLQYLGATACAVGNEHALRRCLLVGLTDGFRPSELYSETYRETLSSRYFEEIPLLFLAVCKGHSATCKLLMESLGDSIVFRPTQNTKSLIKICTSCLVDVACDVAHSFEPSLGSPRRCGKFAAASSLAAEFGHEDLARDISMWSLELRTEMDHRRELAEASPASRNFSDES